MSDVQAHLADGTILSFPAGTADDVVNRTVRSYVSKKNSPAPPPPPTFGSRVAEVTTGTAHPIQQIESEIQQVRQHPLSTAKEVGKQSVMGPIRAATQAITHPLDTVRQLTGGFQFGEDIGAKRWGAAVGDIAGGMLNAYTLLDAPEKGEITKNIVKTAAKTPSVIRDLPNMLHAGGLGAQAEVAKAVTGARAEVSSAAEHIAQEDLRRNPEGSIAATPIQADIAKAHDEIVKAPEKYPPSLSAVSQDLLTTTEQKPGQWTWAQAQQLRTKVGDALRKSHGPVRASLSSAYASLSDALESKAKEYGLGSEWTHYNTLHRNLQGLMEGPLGKIMNARDGHEVNSALLADKGATNEMVRNLSKYGLPVDQINKWTNIAKEGRAGRGWRSLPAYVAGGVIARALGQNWYMGALGTGVGYPVVERLTSALRASRHPFAKEGSRLLLGRELPAAEERSVIQDVAPVRTAPPPPPSMRTAAPRQISEREQLENMVPPNLRPGPFEQPMVDAMLQILQETPSGDRQGVATKLREEMEAAFEKTRMRNRMAESMSQYKKKR